MYYLADMASASEYKIELTSLFHFLALYKKSNLFAETILLD